MPFSKAQELYVIHDHDGYSNIRDQNGKIIDRLLNNQVFTISATLAIKNNMVPIEYPAYGTKTKNSKIYQYENEIKKGWIHQSRIKNLINTVPLVEDPIEMIFKDHHFCLELLIGHNFFPTENAIFKGDQFISMYGKLPLGVAGNIPKEGLSTIEDAAVIWNGKEEKIQTIYYHNFFQPNTRDWKVYKNDTYYYLKADGGDGSQYYSSIWVFKENKLQYIYIAGTP
ncbi:hypothetical protein LZQ00_09095 [Sphingobacterium sp. SRCM116780]|uniref:hypothetical protein n=1 Tax=Sphingobacterium sp. SRCM116780 TaxID=2907623 RepID=UPI001F2C5CB7|nr:hypothetical protein [Sphingobacterium sp. SRCM116780]UIR57962.1 hypothetical protein LZQ00_09095 [Sphingobacterium sp. SRCM116780]